VRGFEMEKTADKYLQELYGYDYDHALDYRDGIEKERGPEPCVAAPAGETWGTALSTKRPCNYPQLSA
jgi:hypothetical protein